MTIAMLHPQHTLISAAKAVVLAVKYLQSRGEEIEDEITPEDAVDILNGSGEYALEVR